MPGAPLAPRLARALLRAGRAACLAVAVLALLHVTVPHSHAGPADERHCALCQVSRLDGAGVPEAGPAPAPPSAALVPAPRVAVAPAPASTHAAPLPSRGPPPASPPEPL